MNSFSRKRRLSQIWANPLRVRQSLITHFVPISVSVKRRARLSTFLRFDFILEVFGAIHGRDIYLGYSFGLVSGENHSQNFQLVFTIDGVRYHVLAPIHLKCLVVAVVVWCCERVVHWIRDQLLQSQPWVNREQKYDQDADQASTKRLEIAFSLVGHWHYSVEQVQWSDQLVHLGEHFFFFFNNYLFNKRPIIF